MAATDVARTPSIVSRAGSALAWVAAPAKRATTWVRTRPRSRKHDAIQTCGGAVALAGIYHGWGWTATLIIGGVSMIAVSMLREGGHV